ncbi:VWA domain-containing protein [Engelhardtia mirabilis]|uniref:von Willebrand factor type A domain protein n=1 Tax=Engelhardtia mirabilis TaxID=2528011 RepID=A0A518BNB8_9BACT|nr:von Willebrand factor type A domain protein [Planctomycetes bacterium Pla133]QDV02758.1 von Willebrand factor type A domain protein [Planctomycetes bacterium Pla86]
MIDAAQSTADVGLELWGNLALADPVFLAIIPLALLLLAFGRAREGRAAAILPGLPGGAPPSSLRQRAARLLPLLHGTALVLLAVALARPLRADVETTDTTEGIDILCAIDRSGSMDYEDLENGRSRLEVVKEVVGDFARRRMTDRVDAADSVGLLTFAAYPELVCPFTLDADALLDFLSQVELVRYRVEDGTAVGVALAKSVDLLAKSQATSRIVVLLTDGENNREEILPLEAADLAAEAGVKVYTILAGRYVYRSGFGGVVRTDEQLDSTELEAIAERTGGRFYRARDRDSLEAIYAEIEDLERTPRESSRHVDTFDLYPPVLLAALALYLLAWAGGLTFGGRTP